jgi:hypothetical protein
VNREAPYSPKYKTTPIGHRPEEPHLRRFDHGFEGFFRQTAIFSAVAGLSTAEAAGREL